MCCGGDAVDEDKQILCCALCCVNCALYPACDAVGCSGKGGFLCCAFECCLKPGAPCLMPFGCCGLALQGEGCAILNAQLQACCLTVNAAIPCSEEVPLAVAVAGMTLYPKMGCCITQQEMKR